ncbi:AAA family ATPase [Clostridium magnum]|uniref:DNA replication and repair protein RecF n=1 Tax=Clostridium magnum DSM 2767 TaxID=1121326 RepID=A0A162R4C8_9CLOT|nr:AAA family ATPase [Clostridium magnum]KZL89404.1 DNA replication and repair protein RecF [Clostridium magnum DSM 2767]SHI20618.1 AAA ATPase domain-containing protein [Clostridium magnum DSM 2767]
MEIREIQIKNFRSVKEISINNITKIMGFLGKNNSGKSAILNAIRMFWGELELTEDDFHKKSDNIDLKISFEVNDKYINKLILDSKWGINKLPTTVEEYRKLKETLETEGIKNAREYKEKIKALSQINSPKELIESNPIIHKVWLEWIKEKLQIKDKCLQIICKVQKKTNDKKGSFDKSYLIGENKISDIERIFPKLAFVDDDRNFTEEENGKAKTITSKIFDRYIMSNAQNNNDRGCELGKACKSYDEIACTKCVKYLEEKKVNELSLRDLELLIKERVNNSSINISDKISSYFNTNYKDGYKVFIEANASIDKAFSVITKIYDSNLNKEIELSKVGAGVRSIYILSLLQAYHELNNENDILFIIEEPEIYLHPSLQKEMGKILRQISMRNQVVFSSHSPLIIKNCDMHEIREVKLESSETSVNETTLEHIIDELGYSTSDIINSEFVIISEGKDDRLRLEKIIEKFYDVDMKKILILDSNGCDKIETYATLKFLQKTYLEDDFVIIRDSDTAEKSALLENLRNSFNENIGKEYFERIKNKILILDYSSLENYFLNPEKLVCIHAVKSEDDFYEKIEKYINTSEEQIKKYIENHNKKFPEKARFKIDSIYNETSIKERIEDIKKYVRGHELFGIFNKLKSNIHQYIELSDNNDFKEILDHLNKVPYFQEKRR